MASGAEIIAAIALNSVRPRPENDHTVKWLGAPIYSTRQQAGLEINLVTEADHRIEVGLRDDGIVVWRRK